MVANLTKKGDMATGDETMIGEKMATAGVLIGPVSEIVTILFLEIVALDQGIAHIDPHHQPDSAATDQGRDLVYADRNPRRQ